MGARELLSFRHGVHPPENKHLTEGIASRRLPFPKEVILPLSQHIGTPAAALVKAAQKLAVDPKALQLRYLQTLTEIAGDKSSTIVFPLDLVEKVKKALD